MDVRPRGVCDGSCLITRGEQSCRLVAEHVHITEGRGNAHLKVGKEMAVVGVGVCCE